MSDWGNGVVRITVTDGTQRKPRRIGISYDYMDKLNAYVKEGIFIDKDKDGFTKAEQIALGKEFEKLHAERKDNINFRRLLAGKTFDYKDTEFIRLAKAAGYILAEDVQPAAAEKPAEQKKIPAQENKPEPVVKVETKPEEHAVLAQELAEMKKTWTEDELKHPQDTLRRIKSQLKYEIEQLKKPYTAEVVTKRRFLRKDKQELVKTPKTQEQIDADNLKAQEKYKELDKIAKMMAVDVLYSSTRPGKYAGGEGDKFIESIVTTEDGQKLGRARVKKTRYNEEYKCDETYWGEEYYPVSLRNYNEGKENEYPQYYYRVAEDAKPVEGEVKLAQ